MMRGMSCRHLTNLQCESTIPSVSAVLSSLLLSFSSRFFLSIYLPREAVIRIFFSFLVVRYKEYRHEQEKKHDEWLARKRERDERLARGEDVGPEEPDPTAEVEIGLWGLVKFLLGVIVVIMLTGKFVTGSSLWEYDGKWVQAKTYFPVRSTLYPPWPCLATHRWRTKTCLTFPRIPVRCIGH